MAEENRTPTPGKWWQWVLMYPALAIALAGHVPKLYELYLSYKINVPPSEVATASKRHEDFGKYTDCLPNLQFHAVPGGDNASISVGVSPREALVVLVQPHDQRAQPIYRLISWANLANEHSTSLLVKEAAAEEVLASFQVAQAGQTIICRKRLDGGLLLIRISYPNGQCFDQTVNTYTGAVISTVPAPCDPRC